MAGYELWFCWFSAEMLLDLDGDTQRMCTEAGTLLSEMANACFGVNRLNDPLILAIRKFTQSYVQTNMKRDFAALMHQWYIFDFSTCVILCAITCVIISNATFLYHIIRPLQKICLLLVQ